MLYAPKTCPSWIMSAIINHGKITSKLRPLITKIPHSNIPWLLESSQYIVYLSVSSWLRKHFWTHFIIDCS